jgi:hypothetical protein
VRALLRSAVALGRVAALTAAAACGGGGPSPEAAPGASSPGARPAIAIADELEALVDEGRATRDAREEAVRRVRDRVPETAADMLARAIVLGRLVEEEGLAKAHLVKDVERWAMKSRALDPTYRDEAAARVLGTLWVLAPGSLLAEGDSEEGLALLEDLARRRPDVAPNHLRLGEALLALGDAEAAVGPLCAARARADALRPSERALLAVLLRDAGSPACPAAAPSPGRAGRDEPGLSADPAAPASRSTAPPAAP